MSKQGHLTSEEIEEELITNDIINSGGVEDEEALKGMTILEKKQLLQGIQHSKENNKCKNIQQPTSPSLLDRANFPSLPSASRTNTPGNRLRPRKSSTNTWSSQGAKEALSPVINLDDDDEEVKPAKFCLPGFVSDNAPALPMPKRTMLRDECPYYVQDGEDPDEAMQRILAHHVTWRAAYEAELRGEGLDQCDELEMRDSDSSPPNEQRSPLRVPKNNNKRNDNLVITRSGSPSTSRPQRRGSPDSDCVEIDPPERPDNAQLSEWMTATGSRKSKRNCNRAGRGRGRSDPSVDVEFTFGEKWESNTATWKEEQAQSPSTLNNRRVVARSPVVEEPKVQCPICQKDFPQSKVEAHAATCEGFSGSPMDVEEGDGD